MVFRNFTNFMTMIALLTLPLSYHRGFSMVPHIYVSILTLHMILGIVLYVFLVTGFKKYSSLAQHNELVNIYYTLVDWWPFNSILGGLVVLTNGLVIMYFSATISPWFLLGVIPHMVELYSSVTGVNNIREFLGLEEVI